MDPKVRMAGLGLALVTIGLLLRPSASEAVTFELCADEGTIALPDALTYPAPRTVPIWGFSLNPGTGCGPASVPGPVLIVNQGDTVNVNLTNNLDNVADAVSLLFPGQTLVPDMVGAAGGGGTMSYTFTASLPGTYLYSAGMNPDVQVPMGLYGALIVRPTGFPGVPGRAYGGPNSASTAFGTEAVLVLGDIDPRLNDNPHGFNLANYNPTYWLINGKVYPETAPIPVSPGQTLLLRYVNAGSTNAAMTVVGLRQTVIAKDAFVQPFSTSVASETIAAGQTSDMLVIGPSVPGRYPLYNRQMHITNGEPNLTPPVPAGTDRGTAAPHFPGGMMTFIAVPIRLAFSTTANNAVPGILAPVDDADIYAWSGTAYARLFDGSGAGLAAAANIDALKVVDYDTFYMSFAADAPGTAVPGLGMVQDEDIVKYDAGTWSMFMDGSLAGIGLGQAGEDIDAFDLLPDGSIIISPRGAASVPVLGAIASQDLARCVPSAPGPITACTWTMYFDGSDVGLTLATENIDGVTVSAGNIYLSTTGNFAVTGASGQGKDVFRCNGPVTGPATSCLGNFSMYFDGSVQGLPATMDLDAIDLP